MSLFLLKWSKLRPSLSIDRSAISAIILASVLMPNNDSLSSSGLNGRIRFSLSIPNKFVSFNHLPTTATIKIYSLGGTLVRTLDKADDGTQFLDWNLKNQYGYPVASGLYIVRIESGGNEKVLKLALVQETQVLKYY